MEKKKKPSNFARFLGGIVAGALFVLLMSGMVWLIVRIWASIFAMITGA